MQPDQGTAELGLAGPLAETVDAQSGNYTSFPGNQPSSVCSSLRPPRARGSAKPEVASLVRANTVQHLRPCGA